MTKHCEMCGAGFTGRNQRFCSISCSRNHKRVFGRTAAEVAAMRNGAKKRSLNPEWKAAQARAQKMAAAALLGTSRPPDEVERRAAAMRGRRQEADVNKRGATNKFARPYHLRSPENRTFHGTCLADFIRRNEALFLPEDVAWYPNKKGTKMSFSCRAYHGLAQVLRGHRGSWKGWTAISLTETFHNGGEDLLDREVFSQE